MQRNGSGIEWLRPRCWGFVVLLAAGVLGCGEESGGADGSEEAGEKTVTVEPGSTVDGPFGTRIRARQETIDRPVDVTFVRADVPVEDNPLPEGVEARGEAFRISTSRFVRTPPESPFLVWLPTPDGVNLDRVGVAVEVGPDEYETRWSVGGPPDNYEPGETWSIDRAFIFDDGIAVTLPQLKTGAGRVVSVVEHPDLEPYEGERLRSKNQQLNGDEWIPLSHSNTGFLGNCRFFGNAPESCGSTTEKNAAAALARVYHGIQNTGFKKPSLANAAGSGPYVIRLKPCSKVEEGVAGRYLPASNHMWVCVDDDGFGTEEILSIRHEFFHATQYSYGVARKFPDYLIEGQAVASERAFSPGTGLIRADRPPRNVDVNLKATNDSLPQYEVQDFWLFLGKYLGRSDIGYFRPFLNNGKDLNLHDVLSKKFNLSRAEVYWEWVKNQTFEAQYQHSNPRLDNEHAPPLRPNNPCQLTSAAVGNTVQISYAKGAGLDQKVVSVGALSAKVVEITLQGASERYRLSLSANPLSSFGTDAKLYRDYSNPTSECVEKEKPSHEIVVVPPGQSRTIYALLSNYDRLHSRDFELIAADLEYEFDFEVTAPSEGSTHEEGAFVNFQSDVRASEGVEEIVWRTDNPGAYAHGGDILARKEDPAVGGLCPGAHTITATATDAVGTELTDRVTLQMKERAPSVGFVDPPPSTIGTGDILLLKGHAEDHTCESGPRTNAADQSKINWRVDGTQRKTGETFAYKVQKAPGEDFTVHLEYEDPDGISTSPAPRVVEVQSAPAGGYPPRVVIESPDQGQVFGAGAIYLRGRARDGRDGVLSGSALQWRVTDGQGGSVTATGRSVTIEEPATQRGLSYGGITVELTATDSDGKSTTRTVAADYEPAG